MDMRESNGVFYTPTFLVRYIVRKTVGPLLDEARSRDEAAPRVLDPACGDGAFLTEAYRFLLERNGKRSIASPKQGRRRDRTRDVGHDIVLKRIFGVDIDGAALAMARERLLRITSDVAENPDGSSSSPNTARWKRVLRGQLRQGDALLDAEDLARGPMPFEEPQRPFSWHREFGDVFRSPSNGFDAIIGNPPYVNIRRLTRSRGAAVKRYLRERYDCARGAYDLYVLFLEKAFQLLRPGGRCGMVVPNKIAAADYARACRSLLLQRASIQEILDVSEMHAFPDAGVYPYVVIWRKQEPAPAHRVSFYRARTPGSLSRATPTLRIRQATLCAKTGFPLEPSLDVESRVLTRPLEKTADLHSGTTGFVAQQVAQSLAEREDFGGNDCFDFIVSGNIDRYQIRRGDVRYMKRVYRRPVLAADCDLLSSNKRQLFRGPKIVVAGMTRRLEAAWDAGGLSLGVQVYAAAQPQEDPWFVLGVLNSKLISHLFRLRFPAKHLAGGYLSINKGQLAQLPMRVIDKQSARETEYRRQIVRRVRRMVTLRSHPTDVTMSREQSRRDREFDRIDHETDTLVYQLYALTTAEIERVETAFAA
ncbi:MAG: Eco57I restriction-modification methylase domain-containing protein [Pirellulaceae bacterium]